MLPRNCFHSFFVWMRFSVCFVYNGLCALCHGTKKMVIVISGFAFIYKYIYLVLIIGSVLFFSLFLRNRESMFCAAFFSRKTNLLDFNINIGT